MNKNHPFDRHFHLGNYDEFIEMVEKLPHEAWMSSHKKAAWNGTADWESAMTRAKEGWPQGIKALSNVEISDNIFDAVIPPEAYEKIFKNVMAGGAIDMESAIADVPEQFISETQDETKVTQGHKLLRFYINGVNNHTVKKDAFFYRGAIAYKLIEYLEVCGYSVEVTGLYPISNGQEAYCAYVTIKEFNDLIDPNKLCVSLCSVFMLRRFMFFFLENQDEEFRKKFGICEAGGYGQEYVPNKEELELENPEDALFFAACGMNDRIKILEDFQNMVSKTL